VADEGPGNAALLELLSRDLAGEGTVGLVEDVLSGNLEALAEVLACEKEVERGRSDDNLCSELAVSLHSLHSGACTYRRSHQAWPC